MSKLYRHYKGNLYEYKGECLHSETLEEMVIYRALYGEGKTWVRPKAMFFEDVTLADGKVVPRFAPVCSCAECMFFREQADGTHKCSCSGRIVNELSEACSNLIAK